MADPDYNRLEGSVRIQTKIDQMFLNATTFCLLNDEVQLFQLLSI